MIRKPLHAIFLPAFTAMALTMINVGAAAADKAAPAPEVLFSGPILKGPFNLNSGAKIVDDGVEVNTMALDGGWQEFLQTVPGKTSFITGKSYIISYDYAVKEVGDGTHFYHFLKCDENRNADKQAKDSHWFETADSQGHKEFTVTIGNQADLKFVIGVFNKGAIRIENLKIEEAL